jgi:allantoate deiminase
MRRCDALGAESDDEGCLTRTFHSPAMQRVNAMVGGWMREAGLDVREDAAFNLLGRWPSPRRGARTLLLGSHLDTVREAGKYDGPMGVLAALAAVQHLREHRRQHRRVSGQTLPFHVEVVGFSDEEGLRYQTTYLGSGAMAGSLSARDLARIDEKGIERARRRRGDLLAYLEAHIEQGPVLDARRLPLGVVTAIAGQSRIRVELRGRAGHAGTTPMDLRRDALCGAADIVLAAERCGVIATVGQMTVEPGASNVIPGHVTLSLDVRHALDARRRAAVRALHAKARTIARQRGLRLTWTTLQEASSVRCDAMLTRLLSAAVARQGLRVVRLPSGAGHDAAALAAICPVAMLFVRCRGGVSHHPAESIRQADAARAIAVLADAIEMLARAAAGVRATA